MKKLVNATIKTTAANNKVDVDVTDFMSNPMYGQLYIEKGQLLEGIIESAVGMLTEDTREKDWADPTKKNPRIGEQIFSLRLRVVSPSFLGMTTIVDIKFGYTKDYLTAGPARDKIASKLARYLVGIKKQLGDSFDLPTVMSSIQCFADTITGEHLIMAKIPFGEKKKLNGDVEPLGYALSFDPDDIKKAQKA